MQVIDKPWGKEELLEQNDRYMTKRLTMNKGHRCSMQYHQKKVETVYLLSGKLKIIVGNSMQSLEEIIMKPHDFLTIDKHQIHRMEAVEDSVYLEASTPELDDVVRLEDDYQRK
ncbi:MAG: cupin domain-containing protein [Desulfobacterales bacterium]|uniref:Cupin domain-containing protein n=1 Tax=Candidatus Desulfatibia vada TaxID=2841696 RepID=A0A8J6NTM5_9BACT|nr:cupin domain-containing protein [Candidatus Desulfatibia vada]